MDIVIEEENPLKIEIQSVAKVAIGYRNNVGRPTKKNEILFTAPPKSIISLLLHDEKNSRINEDQSETTVIKEETTVEPVKKWTCEYCPERVFYKKSEYKKHSKSHKCRLYKCDYKNCYYSTKFTSNLKTHKRIHTSDYPYVCDECTFRTKFINSLKTHKRLHNSELPFACKYCEYKCNSGSNLKKHCNRKHSKIPNNEDLK